MADSLPLTGGGAGAGAPPPMKLNATAWLICVIAAIGFAFDIFVLLVLPLVIKPALFALSQGKLTPGTDEYTHAARQTATLVNYTSGSIVAGGVSLNLAPVLEEGLRERDAKGALETNKARPAGKEWAMTKGKD